MNVSAHVASLYPLFLVSANLGLGVGLYTIGAVVFALALWVAGVSVLVGVLESSGLLVTRHRLQRAN